MLELTNKELARRITLAIEQSPRGTQARIAEELGISAQAIVGWKDTGTIDKSNIPALAKHTKRRIEYFMDASVRDEDSAASAVPIFSRERRANDDVTALQIAIESLATVLLRRVPGAASEFLADLKESGGENFSTDYKLLGALSDIAERVRDDEAAASRVRRRAGSARGTRRDT